MITQAESYARALLGAAQQHGSLQRVAKELGPVTDAFALSPGFFYSPDISAAKQISVLRGTLKADVDQLIIEFLVMLARHRKMRQLPTIRRHFERLANEALGLITVRLYLPFAPDETILGKIRAYLVERGLIPAVHASDAVIKVILDKSLLGGFIAEQGGQLLDVSLKSKLIALRKSSTVLRASGLEGQR